MPPVVIAAIISAATTLGTTLYSHFSQPGQPKQPTPTELTNQAVNQETQRRGAATREAAQFLPGIESNSPGVSPDYLKDVSATFSGNANLAQSPEMQQLVARFLGLDTGASFGGQQPFGSSGSNALTPGLTG